VTFLEVPHFGHGHPPAQWFEKGIVALDKSKPNPPPATGPTTQPRVLPTQIAQAKRMLITAQYEIKRDRKDAARKYLQQVLDDYAATPSAAAARKVLDRLDQPATKRAR